MTSYDLELFFFGTLILGVCCFLLKKLNTLCLNMNWSANESIIRESCIKMELAQIKSRLSTFEEKLRMGSAWDWRMKYDDLKNKLMCLENESSRDEKKAYLKYKMQKLKLDGFQRYTRQNPEDTVAQRYGPLATKASIENPSSSTYLGPMTFAVEPGINQWPSDPWIPEGVYQSWDDRNPGYNDYVHGMSTASAQATLLRPDAMANIGGGDGHSMVHGSPPIPPPPTPPPPPPPQHIQPIKAAPVTMANDAKTDERCRLLYVSPDLLNEQIAKLKKTPTNVVLH